MMNLPPATAGQPLAGRSLRRKAMLGSAVAAGVLAAGGPALACVTFKGQMTLIGEDLVPHVVTGSGSANHADYCFNGGPKNGGPVVVAGVANQPIVVRVGPANCPSTGPNQLAAGSYQVALVNGPAYEGATSSGYLGSQTLQPDWGCFSLSPAYSTSQKHTGFPGSAFTIDSAGVGTTVIRVPSLPVKNKLLPTPTGPSDASVLCVGTASNPLNNPGIFAPFTVL